MDQDSQSENPDEVNYFLDRNGVFLDISENVGKLAGYKKEEVVGQNFRLFIHPQDLPGLCVAFQKVLEGTLHPYEYRIITKNGDYILIRSSSHPVKQNGVIVGIKGTLVKL
jgi:PAS domain S-box-containing protein